MGRVLTIITEYDFLYKDLMALVNFQNNHVEYVHIEQLMKLSVETVEI
jgi:hypothetical protein